MLPSWVGSKQHLSLWNFEATQILSRWTFKEGSGGFFATSLLQHSLAAKHWSNIGSHEQKSWRDTGAWQDCSHHFQFKQSLLAERLLRRSQDRDSLPQVPPKRAKADHFGLWSNCNTTQTYLAQVQIDPAKLFWKFWYQMTSEKLPNKERKSFQY